MSNYFDAKQGYYAKQLGISIQNAQSMDVEKLYYLTELGAESGNTTDLKLVWLKGLGYEGDNLEDLWKKHLVAEGFTQENIADAEFAFYVAGL